jgi:hypothetical protein
MLSLCRKAHLVRKRARSHVIGVLRALAGSTRVLVANNHPNLIVTIANKATVGPIVNQRIAQDARKVIVIIIQMGDGIRVLTARTAIAVLTGGVTFPDRRNLMNLVGVRKMRTCLLGKIEKHRPSRLERETLYMKSRSIRLVIHREHPRDPVHLIHQIQRSRETSLLGLRTFQTECQPPRILEFGGEMIQ